MTNESSNEFNLPSGVGPHEGKELELMRAGLKDVALFIGYEPENLDEYFAENLQELRFKVPFTKENIEIEYLIIFRSGFFEQAKRLKEIKLLDESINPVHEFEVGRILSYSDVDIQSFLDHVLKK